MKKRGEIATILTIGTFIVLTAASIVSSIFLQKGKQTTSTRAQSLTDTSFCTYCSNGQCVLNPGYNATLPFDQQSCNNPGLCTTNAQCADTAPPPADTCTSPNQCYDYTCPGGTTVTSGTCEVGEFGGRLCCKPDSAPPPPPPSTDGGTAPNANCATNPTASDCNLPCTTCDGPNQTCILRMDRYPNCNNTGCTAQGKECLGDKGGNVVAPTPCPNGKIDKAGQCNGACCSSDSQCQTGEKCAVQNGYCFSGLSCAAVAPSQTVPLYARVCGGNTCGWTFCNGATTKDPVRGKDVPCQPSQSTAPDSMCQSDNDCKTPVTNSTCFYLTDEIYYNAGKGFSHNVKFWSPTGGGDGHISLSRNGGNSGLQGSTWNKSADNPFVAGPEFTGGYNNNTSDTASFVGTADACKSGIGTASISCGTGRNPDGSVFVRGGGCELKNQPNNVPTAVPTAVPTLKPTTPPSQQACYYTSSKDCLLACGNLPGCTSNGCPAGTYKCLEILTPIPTPVCSTWINCQGGAIPRCVNGQYTCNTSSTSTDTSTPIPVGTCSTSEEGKKICSSSDPKKVLTCQHGRYVDSGSCTGSCKDGNCVDGVTPHVVPLSTNVNQCTSAIGQCYFSGTCHPDNVGKQWCSNLWDVCCLNQGKVTEGQNQYVPPNKSTVLSWETDPVAGLFTVALMGLQGWVCNRDGTGNPIDCQKTYIKENAIFAPIIDYVQTPGKQQFFCSFTRDFSATPIPGEAQPIIKNWCIPLP